jgi:hypothetical protein
VVLQLTSSLQMRAANRTNLQVKPSSDCRQWDVEFHTFYNYRTFYRTSKSIYLHHLLENNAVIKKKVHENNKMAAKTELVIYYGKSCDSILRICPWHSDCQWSVDYRRYCVSDNEILICSLLYRIQIQATFVGQSHSVKLTSPS